jgi:hypothetical protein
MLTHRWYPLHYHQEQARLWKSDARYNIVPAGRRSGKTELVGKRKIVLCALNAHRKDIPFFYRPWPDPRFFVAAPTRDQVKRIYWYDLKALIPPRFVVGRPNESELTIHLVTGARICCLGMDRPERIEGVPWDGGVLDEYANMKKDVWAKHVRPALSDRRGWCDFIGVPEGRNHYYDLYKDAQARVAFALNHDKQPSWDCFHWVSEDILPIEEIEAAKADLDELTYQQEFLASFVNFTGRAYWAFDETYNVGRLDYDPNRRIDFCFDFNVDPGVAVVVQEQNIPQKVTNEAPIWADGIINEVFIPQGSNTLRVVDKLIDLYADHQADIFCYGDFTGGARGSAAIQGSDWELIKRRLRAYYSRDRVHLEVKPNPRERDRINAVNSRICSFDKHVRLMVDPEKAPHTIKDFEGVTIIEGGVGEIDKRKNPQLSHLSDAYGYRTWVKYPLKKRYEPSGQKYHR